MPPVPETMATQVVSTSDLLNKIAHWDGSPHDVEQVLNAAFDSIDYPECISDLRTQNIDPLLYINSLDKVSSFSIFGWPSIHHNRAIDHRSLPSRLRSAKTLLASIGRDLRHIRDTPHFPHSSFHPHQKGRPTTVWKRRLLGCLETHRWGKSGVRSEGVACVYEGPYRKDQQGMRFRHATHD